MAVLYRKYRPQTFADVTGQEHVTQTLVAAIAAGRVAHAYLFSGPRGVGKTTSARLLAKAVNCENNGIRIKNHGTGKSDPIIHNSLSMIQSDDQSSRIGKGEPCNRCTTCKEITEGRCLDVIEIDAASHTGVDHVREHIVDTARLAPARAAKRVFIIDEVHMLSTASFNALLKTIEEPPAHILFILATTELHRVPETVRSRCQHFAFRRVAPPVLERRLQDLAKAEGIAVDADVFAAVARAADGSVRDAETLLGQLIALSGDRIRMSDAATILPRSSVERAAALVCAIESGDARAALEELRVALESGFDADAYLRDVMLSLRDRLHAAVTGAGGQTTILAVALRQFADLANSIHRTDQQFFAIEVIVLGLLASRVAENSDVVRPTFAVPRASRTAVRQEGSQAPAHSAESKNLPVEPPAQVPQKTELAAREMVSADLQSPEDAARILAAVRSAWPSIIMQLGEQYPSLQYLLEGGRPQQYNNGVLTIGFRYKLHAEKIRDSRVIGTVTDAIATAAGVSLRVATAAISQEVFAELDAFVRPKTGDAVADAALEVFGGRVVE